MVQKINKKRKFEERKKRNRKEKKVRDQKDKGTRIEKNETKRKTKRKKREREREVWGFDWGTSIFCHENRFRFSSTRKLGRGSIN